MPSHQGAHEWRTPPQHERASGGSPMLKVSLRNLAAHKVRLALTLLAVILGTAFVSGTFIFTDTLNGVFDKVIGTSDNGVDVEIDPGDNSPAGVPLAEIDTVRGLPGVAAAWPNVGGTVVLLDKEGNPVQTGGVASTGINYSDEAAARENWQWTAGGPPKQPGEVAFNTAAAQKSGLGPGDATRVMYPARGFIDVTVVGVYDTPNNKDDDDLVGAAFNEAQAMELFSDGTHVNAIDVAAASGTTPEQLSQTIGAALPNDKVRTGAEAAKEAKAAVTDQLSFITYFLLAFGAIALLVGTFIIYNTFAMIVAQRMRELALLRAIGASRGQIARSVVLEAAVVGLIGSALGIVGGVGLAYGLQALLVAVGAGFPSSPLVLQPRTFIIALILGLLVTLASAYVPARRAGAVAPVAAMRGESSTKGESLVLRTSIGGVLALIGLVVLIVGSRGNGESAALTVGIGAFFVIVAVLMALPAMSKVAVSALGFLAAPFGAIGKLARTNSIRNPRRTAATAFALTLGLMLVSVIGVFGASAKESVSSIIDDQISADYVVMGIGNLPVPTEAAKVIEKAPGVGESIAIHPMAAKVGNDDQFFGSAITGNVDSMVKLKMTEGKMDLTGRNITISTTAADKYGWRVGRDATFTSGVSGQEATVPVVGIYEDSALFGGILASEELYDELVPTPVGDYAVGVRAAPGTSTDQLRENLEQAVKPFTILQVQTLDEFKGTLASQINMIMGILYGLLALAVVIAILGIVNTLALSVVERKREIGMLRAVGTQRSQVRTMIYIEALLIAIFGAIVGVVMGLLFGWAFVQTMAEQGLKDFVIPWEQVILMLVGAALAGIVASVWPAITAARTQPLEAIVET